MASPRSQHAHGVQLTRDLRSNIYELRAMDWHVRIGNILLFLLTMVVLGDVVSSKSHSPPPWETTMTGPPRSHHDSGQEHSRGIGMAFFRVNLGHYLSPLLPGVKRTW